MNLVLSSILHAETFSALDFQNTLTGGKGSISKYILTYSMVQSPSWEANRFSASQEASRILGNPKVHNRTHKCLPPVPSLNQLDPVHAPKVQVRGFLCERFVTWYVFTARSC